MRNSEINHAHAIEKSLLVAVATASLGDTTPTPSLSISAGRSPQISKTVEKSKGKEPAHSTLKSKRTREGGKTEPPRKKTM